MGRTWVADHQVCVSCQRQGVPCPTRRHQAMTPATPPVAPPGATTWAALDDNPLEDVDQTVIATLLDYLGVLWCHVPNGGHRSKGVAGQLKAQGVKTGVPDILIFDPPPNVPGAVGAAIEMKRRKKGHVSNDQKKWLDELKARNWATAVCHGEEQARQQLRDWGYLG